MRHKILLALRQLPKASEVCLGNVPKFDETFVLDCYKGKSWIVPLTKYVIIGYLPNSSLSFVISHHS